MELQYEHIEKKREKGGVTGNRVSGHYARNIDLKGLSKDGCCVDLSDIENTLLSVGN